MTNKLKMKIIIKQYKRANKKFFLAESLKALKHIFYIAGHGESAEKKLLWTINLVSGLYPDDIKRIRKTTKKIILGYAKQIQVQI